MKIKTAVILAAGKGTRLREYEPIKPLTKVGGLALITRVILSLQLQGVEKIIIVVGYQKDQIIEAINKEKRIRAKIEFVENKNYDLANGISLLAAKEHIDSPFFLSMSDHVFDRSILKTLEEQGLENNEVVLSVDFKLNTIFDMDDATKVQVKDKKIINIGKQITDYNAVDTGLFLCSTELIFALEEAKNEQNGDCSLSDGMKKLAEKNKFGAHDIKNAFWQDVDDKNMLEHAEKKLYEGLKKNADGIIARTVNRRVSVFLTKHLFVNINITPNMLTIIAFLVGVLGSSLVGFGYSSYLITLLGFFLFQFSSILDGNDGEIARLKLQFSHNGEWMDTILDDLNNAVFMFAMGLNLYWRFENNLWLLIGILTVISFYIYNFVVYAQLASLPDKPGTVYAFAWWFEKENAAYRSKSTSITDMVRYLARRDLYIFVFLIFAIFNLIRFALVYAFIVAFIHGLVSIVHLRMVRK